ncbi:MAG: hypothetical protein IBX72_02705 [Nitrospirae bacterium]|nr:hypothetical protein [Nitrospirota bacterium]
MGRKDKKTPPENKPLISPGLLLINCPSEYFVHIPMGTFGICDYLRQKNIKAKILNLSLYNRDEIYKKLGYYLELFQPTHIGLIFHWQETAGGVIRLSEYIKSRTESIKIICGGFTAGYFGENLLEKCNFIDFIIKGDPEKPLEMLLKGTDVCKVPNLIYRNPEGIKSNNPSYFIDRKTLSNISFCDLTFLYDYDLYIKSVENRMGFPVFIGRGCIFSCRYCGGSRKAFRLHSGRAKPIARSIESVISDLRRLKEFTGKIYLCYENDRTYIKNLFRALKRENDLVKSFQLNYGAWRLFDKKFLELYRDIFLPSNSDKPFFELSPEVFVDKSREKIKGRKLFYSMRELEENLNLIRSHLGEDVNVYLFFSRYHDTVTSYNDMKKEITGIFRLSHNFFSNNVFNVNISYDHLSTDIASLCWEKYTDNPHELDTLISSIRKIKSHELYSFPFNNLCVYLPRTLSEEDVLRCEMLIFVLNYLERFFPELFHILFSCLEEKTVDLVEEIINSAYINKPGNFFATFDFCDLLERIRHTLTMQKTLFSQIPFIEDLTNFLIKKSSFYERPWTPASFYHTSHPKLDNAFISVNEHDYLNMGIFLRKLKKEGVKTLNAEMTVFIFLIDEILSMTYETYCATIKNFEKGISLNEYYGMMDRKHIFNLSYHKDLIARLFQSGVLY